MTDIDSMASALQAIDERRQNRRRFLRHAGGAGLAGGLAILGACGGTTDSGTGTTTPTPTSSSTVSNVDSDVLNFALNLEYLEAQFYSYAVFGAPVAAGYLVGVGAVGAVTGGAQVPFTDQVVAQFAAEIAVDELAHVNFLRTVLGSSAVSQPALNIAGDATGAFTLAARSAGLIGASDVFNPYASDENFLLGAYLLEDVGVTAYKGATPLLTNKTYLEETAGILATESYHAGLIRATLYRKGIATPALLTDAQGISDERDSLDGSSDLDQGIGTATTVNIVPADPNGLAFSRSTGQVLNIVYLNKSATGSGGFFPSGVNGNIRTSAASG